jgi:hypothetical protein
MPVNPIRPTAAVKPATGLQLNSVEVRFQRGAGFGIVYLFGRVPTSERVPIVLAKPHPKYVLVSETVGRVPHEDIGLQRTRNSADPAGWQYWNYFANFRCRRLSLLVQSNEARAMVAHVGSAVLASEICGK